MPTCCAGWGTATAPIARCSSSITRIIGQGRAAEILDAGEEMVAIDRFFRRVDLRGGCEQQVARARAATPRAAGRLRRRRQPRARRPSAVGAGAAAPPPRAVGAGRLRADEPDDRLRRARADAGRGRALARADARRRRVRRGARRALRRTPRRLRRLAARGPADRGVDRARQHPLVSGRARGGRLEQLGGRARRAPRPGTAMFADDPHLEINRLPAVWYEAQLDGPQGWLAGASMPGVPAILVGRNDVRSRGASRTRTPTSSTRGSRTAATAAIAARGPTASRRGSRSKCARR